jgi:Concanavalin A-like lectin/glucanases superfamily
MQSAAPPADDTAWLNKPGFYMWLLAIGAIVYAYVFATSAVASSYRGINTTTDSTGARVDNVGNQVSLLLGCILAYMGVVKLWSNGQYQIPDGLKWIASVANAFIAVGLLIGLAFVSIRATQYSINLNQITAQDSMGFFGSNIVLMGVIPIVLVIMAKLNGWDWPSAIFETLLQSAQFVLNFWFPLVMMYYFIRLGGNYWFQIVAGVSLSLTILVMCYDWYKLDGLTSVPTTVPETLKQMIKDLWNTFPIAPYFKYVANTDMMDVAKRVMMVALSAYAVYLMINVYKFKHRLIPCIGTDFTSCFGISGMTDASSKNTPYVNALIWTLFASAGANVVNWLLQMFPFYNWINDWANGTTTPAPSSNMTWPQKFMQLLKLVLFPIYWIFALVLTYPVATIVAVMVFAVVGLLLYRSSFDLTDFIEGQRGTVITLFTLFIASLIVFALYAANSTTAELAQGAMTYGQFIGKTGLVLAIAVCIVGLLMYFLNSNSKLSTIVGIVQFGITAMIYIVGIAIVIGAVRTMISSKIGGSMFQVSPDSNWVINLLKLFGNLLFYMPCLMLDFADMLKEQYGLTTRPILILLVMEALFILAGYFLPAAVARAINHTGVQILSAPISMNALIPIKTYDVQFVNAHGGGEFKPVSTTSPTSTTSSGVTTTTVQLKNYSYGVSAWFYIHPQPPNMNANSSDSTVFTNLLQVGSWGPSIQYNSKSNTMQFELYGAVVESSDKVPLEVSDITLQTWNNVVINSDKGAVDIFINNQLIYTGMHLPKTNDHSVQNVTVGQADGVHGEMCNVVLNTAPFTKPEIAWLYKTNRVMNPPVVGVNMDPQNQGYSESDLATEAVGDDPSDLSKPVPTHTAMPTYSVSGTIRYSIVGAVLGVIVGLLFNNSEPVARIKGALMGAIVFGLIGALLGGLFSTDGTVAYVFKTVANVFVDTF